MQSDGMNNPGNARTVRKSRTVAVTTPLVAYCKFIKLYQFIMCKT